MPGRNFARRLGGPPGKAPSKRRARGVFCAAAVALLGSISNCGFPEYTFPGIPAGAPGGGGTAVAGQGSGGSVSGGAAGTTSGGHGGAVIGDAGDAGDAG